jgi:hypothetical protein
LVSVLLLIMGIHLSSTRVFARLQQISGRVNKGDGQLATIMISYPVSLV